MTATADRPPVVVDTNVFGARFRLGSELAELYAPVLAGRVIYLSFATDAELRYGARLAGWGERRLQRLQFELSAADVVFPNDEVTVSYVGLRVACSDRGRGPIDKFHEADRWIAAPALWLGLPLVTRDAIFLDVPGLVVETRLDVA